MSAKCPICQGTGKRPGSDHLDCGCKASTNRYVMNAYVDGLRRDRVPEEDILWMIHRRAQMLVREGIE